jgi:hypothetical protein
VQINSRSKINLKLSFFCWWLCRCGTNQTGNLVVPDGPNVDGLIGFGQPAISVPSQLAAQGLVGKAFAHCLLGDNSTTGAGSLVIGNVTDPGISYTPMVPDQ